MSDLIDRQQAIERGVPIRGVIKAWNGRTSDEVGL